MKTTMGKYLSKDVNVAASGSQESTGETCNQDTVDTSTSVDEQNMLGGTENRVDRTIDERCNMLSKVPIELPKYSPNTRDISSNDIDNSTLKSNDYRDKVIHVPKLLAQLLNAKVVLERLEEPLIKSYRRFAGTTATIVHANFDNDVTREKNSKDYTRRYCAKCKKTVMTRINDSKMRNCSDCKTEMMYLCIKCNVKHYKRYGFLKYHLDRCKGNGKWPIDGMDEVDRNESNVEDTRTAGDQVDCIAASNEAQFIVKQIRSEYMLEEFVRYCSECDVVMASCNITRCSKCGKQLLFACKKCSAKYELKQSLLYHLRNQCYPINEYQCTHCNYTTTCRFRIQEHFKNMHTHRPSFEC